MSKNEAFDVADLSSALNAANREEIFNAVMNKLEGLDGEYSDFLENLSPIVRKRVDTLMEIQAKHDDVKAKYFEERAVLDAKYQMLYQPLYNERSQILNGVVEVDSETKVEEDAHQEKGVPEFWLTAMKNNSVLADEISERDEAALRFLNDIKCSRTDKPLGFKLEFFFDANPFFKNSVLTKTYHLVDEYEPVLDKAIGTEIEWYPGPGKCLTQRIVVKKPKNSAKKAKRNVKPEPCQSFFNFFDPPQLPEEDDKIDEGVAEKHQNLMEHDYDIGSTIRDKIIPNAVSWFTGEAAHRTFEDEPEDPMIDQPPN